MADLTESFEILADTDMWVDVAVLFAGFLAPTVARNLIEPNSPWDLPDEIYGVGVVAGSQYVGGDYSMMASLGGGLYVADKLAERFNLKQRVTSVGGGN